MFLSALLLFGTSFLPISHSSERCEPPTCPESFQMMDVGGWRGDSGKQILIKECSNAYLIRFYQIELTGFEPDQTIQIDPIETVWKKKFVVTTNECGAVLINIYPSHPKRDFIVLDFGFSWDRQRVIVGVNKYLAQEPEVSMPEATPPKTHSRAF